VRIFKMRVALLGVLALFVASGIAASTASAGGPYWHVNGSKLGQGAIRQLKLQLKGTAVLSATVGANTLKVECKNGVSEGATIEGQGNIQGQDKGRITFTQCVLTGLPGCKVHEPITTVQTKSHLGFSAETQKKYVELFEPQQGTRFATLIFEEEVAGGCGVLVGPQSVTGTVAAEVSPIESEAQEGLLNFPATVIKHVTVEQQTKTNVGLTLGGMFAATFNAVFGARLETNEPWGVFGQ
jgi:hypothetical protein